MIDQNVSSRYIKRWRLEQLLKSLFPEVREFYIRVYFMHLLPRYRVNEMLI